MRFNDQITRNLDTEFGCAELCVEEEDEQLLLIRALQLGWSITRESFNEDGTWAIPREGNPSKGFPLSGSKTQRLFLVYDPRKWVVMDFPW